VRALLEGQIQRTDKRVHVNVQLIDAGNDRQLWADTYDRELTAQNVFAIQDSIAHSVAEALRVQLTPAEAAAIAETPTTNMEALDHYHRGRELFLRRGSENVDTAAPHSFERAVALDPQFGAAWAGLAESRSWLIRMDLAYDTMPALNALQKAEALAPRAPETEMARGFYRYYAIGQYAPALTHFQAVQSARPSDVPSIAAISYILRRQGDWNGALQQELRVAELDPRDPAALWDLGGTYLQLRRWGETRQVLERALVLYPDYEAARTFLFGALVMSGDTARAAAFAKESQGHVSAWTTATMDVAIAYFRRDYPTTLHLLEMSRPTTDPQARARLLLLSLTSYVAGNARLTQIYTDSSRARMEADLRRQAGTADVFGRLADLHAQLGLAYALLGRKTEALAEGRKAVELNPVSRDGVEGPRSVAQLAAICLLTGDRDQAFERRAHQGRGGARNALGTEDNHAWIPCCCRLAAHVDARRLRAAHGRRRRSRRDSGRGPRLQPGHRRAPCGRVGAILRVRRRDDSRRRHGHGSRRDPRDDDQSVRRHVVQADLGADERGRWRVRGSGIFDRALRDAVPRRARQRPGTYRALPHRLEEAGGRVLEGRAGYRSAGPSRYPVGPLSGPSGPRPNTSHPRDAASGPAPICGSRAPGEPSGPAPIRTPSAASARIREPTRSSDPGKRRPLPRVRAAARVRPSRNPEVVAARTRQRRRERCRPKGTGAWLFLASLQLLSSVVKTLTAS